MDNYICKIATRDELIKRWDDLIEKHPNDDSWKGYKVKTLNIFDKGTSICYLGILNGKIIAEVCAHISKDFEAENLIDELVNEKRAYLNAFRCDKEYEGKGYFSALYHFMENDLKKRGYKEVSLGVEPCEVRNIMIYFHLGFTNYVGTGLEEYLPEHEGEEPIKAFVNYYYKEI